MTLDEIGPVDEMGIPLVEPKKKYKTDASDFKKDWENATIEHDGKKMSLQEFETLESFESDHHFFLMFSPLKTLPKNLKVYSLNIDGTDVEQLPENLKVEGNLGLSETKIKSLPKNLNVRSLNIKFTPITNLSSIRVRTDLDLRDTEVENLGEGIEIDGHLMLNSKIKSLPEDLIVGGMIFPDIDGMRQFPEHLKYKIAL